PPGEVRSDVGHTRPTPPSLFRRGALLRAVLLAAVVAAPPLLDPFLCLGPPFLPHGTIALLGLALQLPVYVLCLHLLSTKRPVSVRRTLKVTAAGGAGTLGVYLALF